MQKTQAVYPGTFDPPTVGHLWMIRRGAELFGNLTVAIGTNPNKHCLFLVEERLDMLNRATGRFHNIRIDSFTNKFLMAYAKSVGAQFVLRGIRNATDFEYERTLRNINEDMNPGITTVFLVPPRDIAEVSSSMVKSLIGPEGWEPIVTKYVPPEVFESIAKVNYAKVH